MPAHARGRRVPWVVLPYTRRFPFPLPQAYAWLTDYRDDDPQRTGHIIKKRPVVERTKDRVVLEGELELLGRRMRGRAEVHLSPPDRWEARFQNGTVYRYRLEPDGAGCVLRVEYRIRTRRWRRFLGLLLARGRVLREIDAMWDGFARSMAAELGPQRAAR
jgi:hypothetical protein